VGAHLGRSDGVLAIRPISVLEAVAIVDAQDAQMVRRFGWGAPLTLPASQVVVRRWVRSWQSLGLEPNSAIVDEVTGQMIGDCEAELRGDGFVHVLYAVFAPWRGQGVAERAVRLLADYSAEAFPYCPLLFRVERDNVASLAVARSVGAVVTGQEVVSDGRRLLHLMVAVDDRCRVGAAGEP